MEFVSKGNAVFQIAILVVLNVERSGFDQNSDPGLCTSNEERL